MKNFISIYKNLKKEGMYLYVSKENGLSKIPDALLSLFGTPTLVTYMLVTEDKKFAKFTAKDLLTALNEKGFYLQMPEPLEEYRQFLVASNQKLTS